MATKSSEARLVQLTNGLGWYHHKYGDVRYCPVCHVALPKSERAPDFAIAPVYTWVECKNSDASGRWNWQDDIGPEGKRQGQRQWLKENGGWLFIELGTKPAPKGKGAWLIPWPHWETVIEPELLKLELASLRFEAVGLPMHKNYRMPASELLGTKFALKWVMNSGWVVPKGHPFWEALNKKLEGWLSYTENML